MNRNEMGVILDGIIAAAERAPKVPPGPTLIDQISEADWNADASEWNINAGEVKPA
jgi:hypothetical protein